MNCKLLATFLCMVHVALAASHLPADDGARKLTSAERLLIAKGAAWGAVIPLADGSLGIVYQRARPVKEFDAVNVSMEWVRSTHSGRIWSQPVLIAERLGPDGKLFENRPEGGYIVFQERNEALGQLPSGRIVCAFCELNYHYDKDGKTENRPGKDYPHENQGIVYTWSDDLGKTWVKTRKMDTAPAGGRPPLISPHWRIVTLKDGTALMTIYGSYDPQYKGDVKIPEGTKKLSVVIRSIDNGETWGDVSVILAEPGTLFYEETALCLLDNGTLLAHVRTPRDDVVQYTSGDGGRTWSGTTPLTQGGQQPGGAFQLAGGKVMATWGNRRAPFGAAAMLSSDRGKTWDYDHRVSLAWDAPNGNCGYANGAQAADGTIVVVYYIMPVVTDYRSLWTGSTVFAARFTLEQFLEAAAKP